MAIRANRFMFHGIFLILFFIFSLSLGVPAQSTISTWNGGSGFWHNKDNWTPSVIPNDIPTVTYGVKIDGGKQGDSTVTLSSDAPPTKVSGLTIDEGDTLMLQDSTTFKVNADEISNNGTWSISSRQSSTLCFFQDTVITGTGIFDLSDSLSVFIDNPCITMTIGPNQTMLGSGLLGMECGLIRNMGNLYHSGSNPFIINPGAQGWVNQGLISTTSHKGITFTNTLISNTGSIEAGDGSLLYFYKTGVSGGTLSSYGSGKTCFSFNSFLDNVTLNGSALIPDTSIITVTNTLTDTGEVWLTSTMPIATLPTLVFGSGAVVSDTGQILMGDSMVITATSPFKTSALPIPRILTTGFFTQGPFHSIKGGGEILANSGGMFNKGTIVANGLRPLVIDPGVSGIFNTGIISATSSAGLILLDGGIFNSGPLTVTSPSQLGSIGVEEGSKALLQDTQIWGGKLVAKGTGKLIFTHNTFLDNIWLTGTAVAQNEAYITFSTALTDSGEVILTQAIGTAPPQKITISDGMVISGTGTFMMDGHPDMSILCSGIFTHTMPHTIRGEGKLLNGAGGMVNQGTIIGEGESPLIISPDENGFFNSGHLLSLGSQGIKIQNAQYFENQGILEIGQNSLMDITPAYTTTMGATIMNEGSYLNLQEGIGFMALQSGELSGKGIIIGKVFNENGIISPGLSTGCMTIVGAVENSGTILMEIGGPVQCDDYDYIFISGTIDFGGKLDLRFINGFEPEVTSTIPLISYHSHNSEFREIEVSGLAPSLEAEPNYGQNSFSIGFSEKPNTPPSLDITEPSEIQEISTTTLVIRWIDEDPDDDALISLYYSPYITFPVQTEIESGISEDDEADFYTWDTSNVEEGVYIIYGEITDGTNPVEHAYSPGSVKITHITKEELIYHLLSSEILPSDRLGFADFNNDGYIDIADLVFLFIISSPE